MAIREDETISYGFKHKHHDDMDKLTQQYSILPQPHQYHIQNLFYLYIDI